MDYTLASPADDDDWRVFHDIRRKVLFEGRHRDAGIAETCVQMRQRI